MISLASESHYGLACPAHFPSGSRNRPLRMADGPASLASGRTRTCVTWQIRRGAGAGLSNTTIEAEALGEVGVAVAPLAGDLSEVEGGPGQDFQARVAGQCAHRGGAVQVDVVDVLDGAGEHLGPADLVGVGGGPPFVVGGLLGHKHGLQGGVLARLVLSHGHDRGGRPAGGAEGYCFMVGEVGVDVEDDLNWEIGELDGVSGGGSGGRHCGCFGGVEAMSTAGV